MDILSLPCHNDNTYIWRIGELEYVYNYGLLDKLHVDNDSLWVRSVPELITDSDLSEILEEESKYSTVYNTYKNFYEWDAKDSAFKKWRAEGLNVPDFCSINDVNDIFKFVETHNKFIIRVNNSYGGKCSNFIDIGDDKGKIFNIYLKALRQFESMNHYNRSHTRLMVVQFLKDISNEHRYIRSYVCNGKVVLSNDFGLNVNESGINRYYKVDDFDRFLERNRELEILNNNIQDDIIKAVKCFELNFAAVDWMFVDRKCYLLEINPYWGMGYEDVANGFPFFPQWKPKIEERYSEVPNNIKIRIETNSFWDIIYKESFPYLFEKDN